MPYYLKKSRLETIAEALGALSKTLGYFGALEEEKKREKEAKTEKAVATYRDILEKANILGVPEEMFAGLPPEIQGRAIREPKMTPLSEGQFEEPAITQTKSIPVPGTTRKLVGIPMPTEAEREKKKTEERFLQFKPLLDSMNLTPEQKAVAEAEIRAGKGLPTALEKKIFPGTTPEDQESFSQLQARVFSGKADPEEIDSYFNALSRSESIKDKQTASKYSAFHEAYSIGLQRFPQDREQALDFAIKKVKPLGLTQMIIDLFKKSTETEETVQPTLSDEDIDAEIQRLEAKKKPK